MPKQVRGRTNCSWSAPAVLRAEGWGDRLYPWQSPVDLSGLPPGTYSFVAMTDDPSDGEGHGPTEDSKTIMVQ